MRVNEVKISRMSDKVSKAIKKRSINDIKADMKSLSFKYTPLDYSFRESCALFDNINPLTLYNYFSLFLSFSL